MIFNKGISFDSSGFILIEVNKLDIEQNNHINIQQTKNFLSRTILNKLNCILNFNNKSKHLIKNLSYFLNKSGITLRNSAYEK